MYLRLFTACLIGSFLGLGAANAQTTEQAFGLRKGMSIVELKKAGVSFDRVTPEELNKSTVYITSSRAPTHNETFDYYVFTVAADQGLCEILASTTDIFDKQKAAPSRGDQKHQYDALVAELSRKYGKTLNIISDDSKKRWSIAWLGEQNAHSDQAIELSLLDDGHLYLEYKFGCDAHEWILPDEWIKIKRNKDNAKTLGSGL